MGLGWRDIVSRICVILPLAGFRSAAGQGKGLMKAAKDLYYEPWDPACQENIFETYALLHEHAPVYRAPTSGTWAVSSYESVSYIMNRPDLFSNRPNQDETIGFPPKIDPESPDSEALIGRLLRQRPISPRLSRAVHCPRNSRSRSASHAPAQTRKPRFHRASDQRVASDDRKDGC